MLAFFVFFTSVLRCYVAVVMVIVTMQGMLKESERPESVYSLFLGLWIICTLQGRRCRNYVTTVDTSTFKGTGGFLPLIQTRRWMMSYYCKR